MAIKKTITAKTDVVIISDKGDESAFPVGYRFIMGGIIYNVTAKYESDNTQMRRLVTGQGDIQEVTVATLRKDAMEADFRQLESTDNAEPKDE